jgi:hypothetical protein
MIGWGSEIASVEATLAMTITEGCRYQGADGTSAAHECYAMVNLRAECVSTTLDTTIEGFVASMGQFGSEIASRADRFYVTG